MECTQQLELTQTQTIHTERICAEQIGFLGILGTKHPVKRGPNKIGRDPATCNIVLNLNSISRQHAVINVLNNQNFMLMDLDSANKTRLNNKSLDAYIPVPLRHGDTVQFGEVFGIFRLLEEDAELPSTQAFIPDTPLPNKHFGHTSDTPIPNNHFLDTPIPHKHAGHNPDTPIPLRQDGHILDTPLPNKHAGHISDTPIPNHHFLDTPIPNKHAGHISDTPIPNHHFLDTPIPNKHTGHNSDTPIPHRQDGHFLNTPIPHRQDGHIPDTPLPNKHASRVANAIVPESPDVSDKDDSFIIPSQPKPDHRFKSPNNNKFVKSSSKTIAIQPIGTNKIDNIYWNSSKKSNSFNLDVSTNSINDFAQNDSKEIQPLSPVKNESTDSIYTAETQLPPEHIPSIYSQATQLPDLPSISKAVHQNDADKENYDSTFNAETNFSVEKENSANLNQDDIYNANTQLPLEVTKNKEDIFEAETQLPFEKPNSDGIFEAETQLPPGHNNDKNIHEMETQLPFVDKDDSPNYIFTAETQLPTPVNALPSIHSQDTQVPNVSSKTDVGIHDADTQFIQPKPATSTNNNDDEDFFDAETQLPKNKESHDSLNSKDTTKNKSEHNLDKSDEIILFDDVEAQSFLDDDFNSQPILGTSAPQFDNEEIPLSQSDTITDDDFEIRLEESITQPTPAKRNAREKSDESTDCEDLATPPTEKIPNKSNDSELTDCEEDDVDGKKTNKTPPNNLKTNLEDQATQVIPDASAPMSSVNFEDLATQVIPEIAPAPKSSVNFEDLATQVIPEIIPNDNVDAGNNPDEECFEDMLTQVIPEVNTEKIVNFEDLPTQVIAEDVPKKTIVKEVSQQYSDEVVASPFKVPFSTPIKNKRKDTKSNEFKSTKEKSLVKTKTAQDEEKYYAATQDIIDDLCSQPDVTAQTQTDNNETKLQDGKMAPSYVESHKSHFEGEIEITINKVNRGSQSSSVNSDKKINNVVVSGDVAKPTRVPSDPSDGEVTPKKVRPRKFMETLLPDSQEIKTSVSLSTKTDVTESSSESEQEKDSQEQTPILHKKKRAKTKVKKDLFDKFDVQALPTRIITRTRKPTAKIQESYDPTAQKRNKNILKPNFLNNSEQDDMVDTEIISENITRLRTKNDKKNNKDDAKLEEGAIKRKSNEENLEQKSKKDLKNKSKNDYSQDVTVDLTKVVDDEKTRSRRNVDRTKNKNTTVDKKNTADLKSQVVENERDEDHKNKSKNDYSQNMVVDLTLIEDGNKVKSRRNLRNNDNSVDKKTDELKSATNKNESKESKHVEKSKKAHTKQEKITNYTISTDDSKTSTSVSRSDESLTTTDTSNCTRSTRHNKTNISAEKSVTVELESTKRKRGRPRKEESKHKTDSKDAKEQKIDDSTDTKRRKKDDNTAAKRRQEEEIKPIEQEVRRSRRQKVVKENSQNSQTSHEQSTVYHRSSESSLDSPKRKRAENIMLDDAPSPKRTRSMTATSAATSLATSSATGSRLRRPTPPTKHRVLLTGFACDCQPIKAQLEKLGAEVVTDVSSCTVVLCPELKRTFKLLCCAGLGRPIVGVPWLKDSIQGGNLRDPWQYILQDAEKEARFGFSLSRTLSGPRNYLRGYYVSATPRVQPTPAEMTQIVACSGGVWVELSAAHEAVGASAARGRWVVVSCAADRGLHAALRARGAVLVSSEFILTGVLRQEGDTQAYLLP